MKEISYAVALTILMISVLLSWVIWYRSPTPPSRAAAWLWVIVALSPIAWGIAILLGVILLWR